MAGATLFTRAARLGSSTASLVSSFRTLAVSPIATQTRTISQSILSKSTRQWLPTTASVGGGIKTAVQQQQQQTRGMKVHSSVKKRCEHCKVRGQSVLFLPPVANRTIVMSTVFFGETRLHGSWISTLVEIHERDSL